MKHITWSELTREYLTHIRVAGYSKGTIRNRRYQLSWLQSVAPSPAKVSMSNLVQFADAHNWEPETRRSFFNAVRALYKWALLHEYVCEDPTKKLAPVKVPQTLGQPPADLVIIRALQDAAPRTRLMIRLGAVLGLRAGEIAVIHEKDWNGYELIVHGKGAKDRLLVVKDPVLQFAFNNMTGYLFPGRLDGHLSSGTVSKLVSRALPDGVTAHKLRHRFATQAYRQTEDILSVAQALGHAKVTTTQRYVGPSRKRLEATMSGALLSAA